MLFLFLLLIIFKSYDAFSPNLELKSYKNIIDYKKIDNIYSMTAIIEAQISSQKYDPIEDKLFVFGIRDDNFKYSKDGMNELLYLSKIYNTSFCIFYNKCNLYDNFRLKTDYTLLYLSKLYNSKIITTRILDTEYIKYGKFPYICSLYENGKYSDLTIYSNNDFIF